MYLCDSFPPLPAGMSVLTDGRTCCRIFYDPGADFLGFVKSCRGMSEIVHRVYRYKGTTIGALRRG
jgi:hypothetical protein